MLYVEQGLLVNPPYNGILIVKKGYKNAGGHAMTIVGNAATSFIAGGVVAVKKVLMLLGVGK